LFLLGLIIRLVLVVPNRQQELSIHEPVNIAVSLANNGTYADAYGRGAGLTAHSAPLHPLLLGLLFRVFGIGTTGELAMVILGSVEASLAFALLPALAVAAGLGLPCGVVAGAAGALLPVNFWPQTSGTFEAPLSAIAIVSLCWLLCRTWSTATFTTREGVAFGTAAGAACLVSPVLIPVLGAWFVVSAVRFRRRLSHVIRFASVSTLCCLVILAPWAIRNYRALGALIWTRSDFGLELQVSNNDFATPSLDRNVAMPEFKLMHPFMGEGELKKLQAAGEVNYERAKLREALAWIASHQARFLALTAQRIRLFWLPEMLRRWQTVGEMLLTVGAVIGLALLFRERHQSAWIFATAIVVYPLAYYVVQSSPRYRFPLECLFFLLAAKTAAVLLTAIRLNRGAAV
jgi:hypothetical protein